MTELCVHQCLGYKMVLIFCMTLHLQAFNCKYASLDNIPSIRLFIQHGFIAMLSKSTNSGASQDFKSCQLKDYAHLISVSSHCIFVVVSVIQELFDGFYRIIFWNIKIEIIFAGRCSWLQVCRIREFCSRLWWIRGVPCRGMLQYRNCFVCI